MLAVPVWVDAASVPKLTVVVAALKKTALAVLVRSKFKEFDVSDLYL